MDGKLKVTGRHPESNNFVELVPGFGFVSFDGQEYVTGGWEKNKDTGKDELAVFEAEGSHVHLGREERVNAGTELELGADPFQHEQQEWHYVKAPLIMADSFNKDTNPTEFAEVEKRIADAKARIKKSREANKVAAEKADKEKIAEVSDIVSKVESYDSRSEDKIQKAPTDVELDNTMDDVMDDIVDMEEDMAADLDKDKPVSKNIKAVASHDEDDEDDSFPEEEASALDAWLEDMSEELDDSDDIPEELETVFKGRKTMYQTNAKEKIPKRNRRKGRRASKPQAPKKQDTSFKPEKTTVDETLVQGKAVRNLIENYKTLDERIKAVEESSSFRNSPDTIAPPSVETRNKSILTVQNAGEDDLAIQTGQFGSRIQAVSKLAAKEEEIMANAELILAICNMDDTTKNALLTIANKLEGNKGNCNIIVM